MRPKLTNRLLGAILFFAMAANSLALPPRQHTARGVIRSIDYRTDTFTLAPAEDGRSLVFFWHDSTQFTHRGSRVCSGGIRPGVSVKVYYRTEMGQLVLREIRLPNDIPSSCGECCCKRN